MTSFRVYRDNQVKISLLGSALIEYDWCPLKKGEIEHRDTHREKTDNGKRHKKKKTIQYAKKNKNKTKNKKDAYAQAAITKRHRLGG